MLRLLTRSVTPRVGGVLLLVVAVAAVVGLSQFQAASAAGGPSVPLHVGGVVPVVGKQVQGSGNLINHGGPVMTTNKAYAVYWVPSGSSMPAGYQSTINQFFTDVAHDSNMSTNVYATDTQYSSILYSSMFAGSTVDTNAFPASGCPVYAGVTRCLTDAQLQAEVNSVIGARAG